MIFIFLFETLCLHFFERAHILCDQKDETISAMANKMGVHVQGKLYSVLLKGFGSRFVADIGMSFRYLLYCG